MLAKHQHYYSTQSARSLRYSIVQQLRYSPEQFHQLFLLALVERLGARRLGFEAAADAEPTELRSNSRRLLIFAVKTVQARYLRSRRESRHRNFLSSPFFWGRVSHSLWMALLTDFKAKQKRRSSEL